MRRTGVVAAAIAGPCLVVAVGFAVAAQPAGTVQGPVPAACAYGVAHGPDGPQCSAPDKSQPVTGLGSSAKAAKSHTVAKALALRSAYHLVPHVHVPYVFRPRIFRRSRIFRRY